MPLARNLRNSGVPISVIERYRFTKPENKNLSYGDVLRSLPPEDGVLLEFWRSAPGGWVGWHETGAARASTVRAARHVIPTPVVPLPASRVPLTAPPPCRPPSRHPHTRARADKSVWRQQQQQQRPSSLT